MAGKSSNEVQNVTKSSGLTILTCC